MSLKDILDVFIEVLLVPLFLIFILLYIIVFLWLPCNSLSLVIYGIVISVVLWIYFMAVEE